VEVRSSLVQAVRGRGPGFLRYQGRPRLPLSLLAPTIFLVLAACSEDRRRDPAAPATERPNVIVVLTDDHGYADLGCQGIDPHVRTPHIDALAAGGVRMTAGYVTSPQCVPSRAGLLTGRVQNRFGIESNGSDVAPLGDETTLAERLRDAGYATGMVGKWHLGGGRGIRRHGFDDVYLQQGDTWSNFDLDGNSRDGGDHEPVGYHLDACSRAARAFVARHAAEPFFLLLSYQAPHLPLDAPQDALARVTGEMPDERRQALAMLALVDDGVGALVDTLRAHDLEGRTLLVFLGDNGAPVTPPGVELPPNAAWNGSLNAPFAGGKGMLTEGGIRVPFLMQWAGVIPAGQVYEHPVSALDIAATALACAGTDAATWPQGALDGVDLLPYLEGETAGAPHAALAWRWNAQAALREGDWKYIHAGQRQYLFDLQQDPCEQHDLLDQRPEIAAGMRERLLIWCNTLQPPGLAYGSLASVWDDCYEFYLGPSGGAQGAASSSAPQHQLGSTAGGPDGGAAVTAAGPAAGSASVPEARAKAREGVAAGNAAAPSPASAALLQGWIARNSSVTVVDGALRVTPPAPPEPPAREPPFLARMSLELPASCAVRVRLRCADGGNAGVSWRTIGQADFVDEQRVAFQLAASADWQERRVALPASDTVIHLRLHLPAAPVDVAEIECTDASGRMLKCWQF